MNTAPVREGRKRRGGLFVNDTEICERLGMPEAEGRRILKALDAKRDSGFPPQHELWGWRRYWPAVEAYFDREYGKPGQAAPRWDREAAMRRVMERKTA